MIIVYVLVTLFAKRLQVSVVEGQSLAFNWVGRAHERYDVMYILGRSYDRRLHRQAPLAQRIVGKLRSSQPRPALRLIDFAPFLGVGIAERGVILLRRLVDGRHSVSFRWRNLA